MSLLIRKIALVGVPLVMAGGLIYGIFLRSDPPASPDPAIRTAAVNDTSTATDQLAVVGTQIEAPGNPSVPASRMDSSKPLDQFHDYASAKEVLMAAEDNDAQAIHYRSLLTRVCYRTPEFLEGAMANTIGSAGWPDTPQVRLSFQSRIDFVRQFCNSPRENTDQYRKRAYELDPSSDVATLNQLREATMEEPPDQWRKHAPEYLDILLRTQSPDAILEAARFLSSMEGIPWEFGRDKIPSALADRVPAIQHLAANMVACDMGGGCGPNGIYVWTACPDYALCRPGLSMDELWRTIYSPLEYGLALRMAKDLRLQRQQYAATHH